MEHLIEIGVFFTKTIIFVGGALVVLVVLFQLFGRGRTDRKHLEVERLNKRFKSYSRALEAPFLKKKELKALNKEEKKDKAKPAKNRRVFVIDFEGDIRAVAVEPFREEVTAVLAVARPEDEVVVRLDSPGGIVTGYGLAAAQLKRIRDRGIPLTICIDKVAASGGYMMACVGTQILAAPFAVVGSVGVVAAFANVHRLLEKNNVDYREITAGEFKRTVSIFGEVTPQGLTKFKEQIQDTHDLFKEFVQSQRPQLDVAQISTGEHWYGLRALELKLVDRLQTSDDYLWEKRDSAEILRIKYQGRRSLADRITEMSAEIVTRVFDKAVRASLLARFGL